MSPLCSLASASLRPLPTVQEILKGILNRNIKSRFWDTTRRRRIKVTLGVPFICRIYRKKKALLQKARYENTIFIHTTIQKNIKKKTTAHKMARLKLETFVLSHNLKKTHLYNVTVSVQPVSSSTPLNCWTATAKLWRQHFRSPLVPTCPWFLDELSSYST